MQSLWRHEMSHAERDSCDIPPGLEVIPCIDRCRRCRRAVVFPLCFFHSGRRVHSTFGFRRSAIAAVSIHRSWRAPGEEGQLSPMRTIGPRFQVVTGHTRRQLTLPASSAHEDVLPPAQCAIVITSTIRLLDFSMREFLLRWIQPPKKQGGQSSALRTFGSRAVSGGEDAYLNHFTGRYFLSLRSISSMQFLASVMLTATMLARKALRSVFRSQVSAASTASSCSSSIRWV